MYLDLSYRKRLSLSSYGELVQIIHEESYTTQKQHTDHYKYL